MAKNRCRKLEAQKIPNQKLKATHGQTQYQFLQSQFNPTKQETRSKKAQHYSLCIPKQEEHSIQCPKNWQWMNTTKNEN